jgi:pyruvate/2-oxoglutarate dehydrogenase complex dihydrolipoamide acyltransferase (E2) component
VEVQVIDALPDRVRRLGFTSLGLGLLIGGLAGGTAATIAAKKRAAAGGQQQQQTPPPTAQTQATPPPPTPPDTLRGTSDAMNAARQAMVRVRKRNSGVAGGVDRGGMTSGAQLSQAVIRPRALTGGTY